MPESVLKILQQQNNLYDEAMMQMVQTNKEQPLPLKQKPKKMRDISRIEKEIIKGSADVISSGRNPSIASKNSLIREPANGEKQLKIMSPEDSFTDARDLCNSTSEYQDFDHKSQSFSNTDDF